MDTSASDLSLLIGFICVIFQMNSIITGCGAKNTSLILSISAKDVPKPPPWMHFYIYRNPESVDEEHEILVDDDLSLIASGYNKSLPLILLFHGVLSNRFTFQDVRQVKDAYVRSNWPANIIMADYGQLTLSRLPLTLSPLALIRLLVTAADPGKVAKEVVKFVSFLMRAGVLSGPEQIHLIGFSLGAHMCGAVGKELQTKVGQPPRRISALEPSLQYPVRSIKLSESDATFVDVTFTSLGIIGKILPVGHVQFFINGGGPHQPHCPNIFPFIEIYCSHSSAPFYFVQSIENQGIMACKCESKCSLELQNCQDQRVYGQSTPEMGRGNYYVSMA